MGQKLGKARAPRKAAETRSKAPKSREPVVHSFEWSTSFLCLRTSESARAGQDFLAAHAA